MQLVMTLLLRNFCTLIETMVSIKGFYTARFVISNHLQHTTLLNDAYISHHILLLVRTTSLLIETDIWRILVFLLEDEFLAIESTSDSSPLVDAIEQQIPVRWNHHPSFRRQNCHLSYVCFLRCVIVAISLFSHYLVLLYYVFPFLRYSKLELGTY